MRWPGIIATLIAAPLWAGDLICPEISGVPPGFGFLAPEIAVRFGAPPSPETPGTETPTDWLGSWRIIPGGDGPAPLSSLEIQLEFGALWLRWDPDLADPCSTDTRITVTASSTRLYGDPEALAEARALGLIPPQEEAPDLMSPEARAELLRSLSLSRSGTLCHLRWTGPDGPAALQFHCIPETGE
ncbi:hypothetical protein [Phaeobacter gallaeciensis]|uniref:hypothetical protein n=1 Tax=Phaeobacter gallaeciensis TaxID=60890 RepID=UPI00237F6AC5|nr:hypothetical protein [Phaeobacter gallaeciensis]MDE4100073.1 hypothetical protein [Phaeobacter gallaeciensis]MDE4108886.1 hypothetical protein [Phaeobacter gallaeciensis]MDE4113332.1 hypothetical protein [Phaeobacter gallaeciensis]MDE4117746.1 hypothetical protein [Phaeobacter gallaeciensis]MDE4122249.1 hypothetical protein [Phaeobacter gallaeciensis]